MDAEIGHNPQAGYKWKQGEIQPSSDLDEAGQINVTVNRTYVIEDSLICRWSLLGVGVFIGSQACLRCPDLEKELNDIKTKRETIKNKISQLELKHKEDKKKWDEDKKEKDKKIKENELEIGNLKKTNEKQQRQKERLSKKKAEMEKKKTEVMEENKKIMARIEKLLAEKEELEKALLVQTGAKEQERLKAENGMLLTRIEQLSKRVNNSELECKRLHEELKKYINFESRKYICES